MGTNGELSETCFPGIVYRNGNASCQENQESAFFLPVALAARIFDVQDQPKNHKNHERTIQTLSKRKDAESNQIGNVKLIAPYCTCLLSSFVMHF